MNSFSMDDLNTMAQIFVGKLLTADFVEAFSQFDDQMKKSMNKTKLISLQNYKSKLEERLKGHVPEAHKHHKESFHNFLKNEIRLVDLKLDEARLANEK